MENQLVVRTERLLGFFVTTIDTLIFLLPAANSMVVDSRFIPDELLSIFSYL
ncbi:hypothetical protein [Microcoleus sp. FACHB-672]|uniref:hypothetical protein n=1 Tax=Microcoleus sp. FACHB-672 TaxID=2692825 RepID=UPI001A7EE85C|nr:hypothetical protein [Microcoleus sp. FACHB-672]